MLIDQYYNKDDDQVTFTRQQSSDFAKQIAGDFNPLHDLDSKRFCVPGDLLFAMVLAQYGASKQMHFTFSSMVTDEVRLLLPEECALLTLNGSNDREYLTVKQSGDKSTNATLIDNLVSSYVRFSGQTFPHILIPLMEQQGVMINPARPLVMYQSMLINLQRFDLVEIELQFDQEKTRFDCNDKRGNICLAFNLIAHGQIIGHGEKHMVVSGLKPFEKDAVDGIIAEYNQWKKDYQG